MRRVRLVPQGVEDQGVEPFEQRPARLGDPADVGAVGQVADPEPQDVATGRARAGSAGSTGPGPRTATPGPIRSNWILGTSPGGQGREPFVEGVVEDAAGSSPRSPPRSRSAPGRRCAWGRPGRRRGRTGGRRGACVKAIAWTCPHPLAEQLEPHLGRGVDQQVAARQREQDARPGPLVPRVVATCRPRSRSRARGRRSTSRCPGTPAAGAVAASPSPRSPPSLEPSRCPALRRG